MANSITWVILGLIILAIVIVILAKFYERGTREVSLVRTGLGGRKVALDGGVLAIPYFNNVARVNMQTLRLEVKRTGNSSLITQDKLRVDVGVEFYVSVIDSEEGVSRAAQTLGNRTFDAAKLTDLIEGKLVDALRSVAARVTMDELHEKRGDFVRQVKEALEPSLAGNGLALESVSLTDMDQTPFSALDENNAFNAAGMRKLSELIARSKKERADIDADAEMAVRQSALTLAKRKLDLELEEEQARINQTQQIEVLKAAQMAEVAARKADSERSVAASRIEMERAIREATIERDRLLREAELKRDLALALLDKDREIQEHDKTREERESQAKLEEAQALVIAANEKVATAKAVAEAERRKRIAELLAEQEAESAGIRVRKAAQSELAAATERAKTRIAEANAATEARSLEAKARQAEMLAEAAGRKAMVEAENLMTDAMIAMKTEEARLKALPGIVAEMVRPAEKIDSIKIHQITGLGQPLGAEGNRAGEKPVVNQALDSILGMAVQLPALKKIGEELGLSVDGSLSSVREDTKDKA